MRCHQNGRAIVMGLNRQKKPNASKRVTKTTGRPYSARHVSRADFLRSSTTHSTCSLAAGLGGTDMKTFCLFLDACLSSSDLIKHLMTFFVYELRNKILNLAETKPLSHTTPLTENVPMTELNRRRSGNNSPELNAQTKYCPLRCVSEKICVYVLITNSIHRNTEGTRRREWRVE